jgi:hypothetical protein
MLRLVLDTNVVLDLFHWGNTDAVPIMAALEAGLIECMADQRTLDELQRVLTYPQLKLTPAMISERYARYSSLVTVFPEGEAAPAALQGPRRPEISRTVSPLQCRCAGQQGQGPAQTARADETGLSDCRPGTCVTPDNGLK